MPERAPYGTWSSPLSASDLATASVTFADLAADGEAVYWLQGDPTQQGRYAVMRHREGGGVEELSPPGFNARTRVHEYGGGALGVGHGVVLAASWEDQRVVRIADGRAGPVTREPTTRAGIRWQGMRVLPGGQAFVAVRETHGSDRPHDHRNVHGQPEAVNEIVHVDLSSAAETVLVSGPDFVGGPWPSPDGTRLAWLEWNHPDMPWDRAELWLAGLDGTTLRAPSRIAGADSAVADVCWADDRRLLFCDDASGWWNLYAWQEGHVQRLQDEPLDVAVPRWAPADRLAVLGDDVYVAAHAEGLFHLRRLGAGTIGTPVPVDGVTDVAALSAHDTALVAIAGGPALATAVWRIHPTTGERMKLSAAPDHPAAAIGATPQPISFPTPDGATAYALYYAPTSATHVGPEDERPPLVVQSHGGPTGAARPGLNPVAQYWASRGLAVVDVNYRGSTGYGRTYRDALKGRWGELDVTDCIAAATYLVERGLVDGDRLVIEGGSAGGYTTLLALCTSDVWAAGGSRFGVADLRALARDTHKFESRYLDSLIGRWPEEEHVYVERSPISHVHRLSTPMIVLQGAEDAVVPPEQAEVIVAALRERGIPHAYLLFEGEQHGFRKAENIQRDLEARLAFYGRILGFEPADSIDLPELWTGTAEGSG